MRPYMNRSAGRGIGSAVSNTDNTEKKLSGLNPFKPGQTGNPLGRPKGSRNKLGEAFVAALHDDFQEHGVSVIETVRRDKPDQYLKVIASILPKELTVNTNALGEMSDDELAATLLALRDLATAVDAQVARAGKSETGERKPAGKVRPVH